MMTYQTRTSGDVLVNAHSDFSGDAIVKWVAHGRLHEHSILADLLRGNGINQDWTIRPPGHRSATAGTRTATGLLDLPVQVYRRGLVPLHDARAREDVPPLNDLFLTEADLQAEREACADILSLALNPHPGPDELRTWTAQQRRDAMWWAGAVHFKASDNVVRKAHLVKPAHVEAWEAFVQCHRAGVHATPCNGRLRTVLVMPVVAAPIGRTRGTTFDADGQGSTTVRHTAAAPRQGQLVHTCEAHDPTPSSIWK